MAMAIQLQAYAALAPGLAIEGDVEPSVLAPYLLRAEDDWLRTIVSRDRHLNVLVNCQDAAIASAVAEISALCGRRLWTSLVPGVLELPEHDGETVVIGDVFFF